MIELPLIFVSGFLGSAHCIGMCGPFAVLLSSNETAWSRLLRRQTVFTLGRIFTYTCMGVVAGFGGKNLSQFASSVVSIPAGLGLAAGVFLIWHGVQASGLFRRRGGDHANAGCMMSSFLGPLLQGKGHISVALAGVFTGMLPCGLVYAFLAVAASSTSLLQGGAVMAAFGAGTAPLMIAAGVSGRALSVAFRRRVYAAAAWCMIVAGCVSIARGAAYIAWHDPGEATPCPFCIGDA